MRSTVFSLLSLLSLLLVASAAPAKPSADADDRRLSGMSIIGNDEAPKSLVIVPWKSSELGDALEVSRALDDGRQPVDRDVFARALTYYRIRSGWDEPRSGAAE